ncbi:MAG: glycosyltransferase family 39 protein, partial [Acidobacteriota bacterium]|nr:glycosyltransferase family 39 protein [Acidobacteriota bacterium]
SLAFAFISVLWNLRDHLWLDETATLWATDRGLGQLVTRCTVFPLSYLYAALIVAIRSLGGSSEWLIRAPSFIASIIAAAIVYRDCRSRWGSAAGWLSVILFANYPTVLFEAGNARPYALALLFVILSTSLLVRLLDRPSHALALGYGLTAALVPDLHILYSIALIPHLIYMILRAGALRRIPRMYLIETVSVFAIAILPFVISTYLLMGHGSQHSYADSPDVDTVIYGFLPLALSTSLLGTALAAVLLGTTIECTTAIANNELIMAACTALGPPLLCFAASRMLHLGLFVQRYWLSFIGGLATCFGAMAGSLKPTRIVRIVTLCVTVASFWHCEKLVTTPIRHTSSLGDWKAALRFVDSFTSDTKEPVLLRSQYVESDTLPIDPLFDNPAFSQLSYYPSRSRLLGLSASFNRDQVDAVLRKARAMSATGTFLLLIHNGPKPAEPLIRYLSNRSGLEDKSLADFDSVQVIEFSKRQGGA